MGFFVDKEGNIRTGRAILAGIVAIGGCVTLWSSTTKVGTGCTGVKVYFGSVQNETLTSGLHLKTPFVCRVVDVNNKIQKVEVEADSTSKDLQSVNSTLAINYRLSSEASARMYRDVGLKYEDTILHPAIEESAKSVMAKYRAEELIQKRSEVSSAIRDEISSKVGEYGIVIDEFNITNFCFSSAFDEAIEQKLVAEQNKIKAATENEQRVAAAQADAAEAKARAEGEAESQRIKAEGEALAIKAKADAQAEANRVINESITNELIDYNRIQKWNGQLPDVMTGSEGDVIVNATN